MSAKSRIGTGTGQVPEIRLRRSILFMPAVNDRAIEKSRSLPIDGLILDLEDAVSGERKTEARAAAAKALTEGGFGDREVVVRVNGLASEWVKEDVAALASTPPDAVLFPKISSVYDVLGAEELMASAGLGEQTALWVMIETAEAVLRAADIAGAGTRLTAFVVGTNDLASDLRVALTADRAALQTSLSLAVLAARASGLTVIDGVFTDLKDMKGFEDQCRQGRTLGFDGKTLVHPDQIDSANEIFGPGEDEIGLARRIVEAWQAAEDSGEAVITVDGRMVEELHVLDAQRLLALTANSR